MAEQIIESRLKYGAFEDDGLEDFANALATGGPMPDRRIGNRVSGMDASGDSEEMDADVLRRAFDSTAKYGR